MLTKAERRMISAITTAAVLVSMSAVATTVKTLVPSKPETNIYLTQPVEASAPSAPAPTCSPLTTLPITVSRMSTVKTVKTVTPAYIAEIPLSEELQTVMMAACEKYDVPYSLALGVCEAESTFQPDADNGICYGLMQINPVNYNQLRNQGIEPTTYDGNIKAGVYMLGQLLSKYDNDIHKTLMAYNCGEEGAEWLWQNGYSTSDYSTNVVDLAEKWQEIINKNMEETKS